MTKVIIRPLREEDALTSWRWRNDPEIWRLTAGRPDREITPELELGWIRRILRDDTTRRFAIVADGTYVGNIQLTHIGGGRAEYDIFIGDRNWWGKGLSYPATRQLLEFARKELALSEVYLSVHRDNEKARRTYLRSGFREISTRGDWVSMSCDLRDILD